jgi:hypothetical protein
MKTNDKNAEGKGDIDMEMNPDFISQNKTERILLYSREHECKKSCSDWCWGQWIGCH